jgi:hypothetical protein
LAVVACGVLYFAVTASAQAASGTWNRAWGKDVITSGHPGDTGTGFEVCTVAADCEAGTAGGLGGGFFQPDGVATDAAGNVYVADTVNQRIQKFDSSGGFRRAWGKDVTSAGPGDTGTGFEVCVAANGDTCQAGTAGALGGDLNSPSTIVTDAAGNVYVADQTNNRIQKFDSSGGFLRAWGKDVIATGHPADTGTGFEICTAAADCQGGTSGGLGGELSSPYGVAADTANNVYISDGSQRLQKFDSSGGFLRAWGKDVIATGHPGDTGAGFEICTAATDCQGGTSGGLGGELNGPQGVATDAAGNVYIADVGNQRIQKFDSSGGFQRAWGGNVVSAGPDDTGGFEICVAANGDTCQAGGGTGSGGEFNYPADVAADAAGNVYVSDAVNQRIQKFDSSGSFLRTWGKDVITGSHPGDTGFGFEICTVASDCQVASSGGLGGELYLPYGVATDASGNVYVAEAVNQRIQKFADPPTPRPTFTSTSPASPANDNSPKVLGSAESGSTVRLYANPSCSGSPVASGTAASFASPGITVSVADNSTTTFHGTAANAEGNTSACSIDSIAYTEDSTAPNTTITAGPSGPTQDSTPTFRFSSTEPGSTFLCRVDAAAFTPCTSPRTAAALADGAHTFRVRARDAAGNIDPTPASRSFKVDTVPPNTTITAGPSGTTQDSTPTFRFSSSEPGSTFRCRVDASAFTPCTSPRTTAPLAAGAHVFRVRARDPAGNIDPTPASRSFKVVIARPQP